ncbi:hypothetical protein Lgee_1478 [Legionella geestiana]|uniref:Uncharacterized protein n=1 Tax=Legionella geestiana TaxID=45065 RepID=A0A0W0TTN6_9GAMM|nr:heparan-alpha-glucosaminide N-acetyltransferase domain-containing protein [Legionella geestiana]KTC98789.1 hypothetical protein Lgee_1478 [Legionella geestiana]QBS12794.1 DUF1624 domain-containing protein [Legionella geestiana]QDQ39489.1 DUF1624 domain-containing protein [Legionella geestiana]STX54728.1 Predicted membrane protein [Legionella geestiana]
MQTSCCDTLTTETTAVASTRVPSVDWLRGLIMIMMALCHTRDYIGSSDYENTYWNASLIWRGTSGVDVLHQLFTLIVPGGFFMLMGVSIVFFYTSRRKDGWSLEKSRNHLLLRGMILVLLQFTVLQLFEIIAENTLYFYMGVLFALGICMMVAACVEYVSWRLNTPFLLPLLIIIAIVIPQQLYVNYLQNQHITPNFWQTLLLLGGVMHYGIPLSFDFTPLPWLPGVMTGLMVGHLMRRHPRDFIPIIGRIALIFIGTLAVFMTLNMTLGLKIGDYRDFDPSHTFSVMALLCLSKYPPSINYYLFSCGINLALLYHLDYAARSAMLRTLLSPIRTIGQCALFFYILHWFVYYGLSVALPAKDFSGMQVLATWLFGIAILYPLCALYLRFRQTRPVESLWRMF